MEGRVKRFIGGKKEWKTMMHPPDLSTSRKGLTTTTLRRGPIEKGGDRHRIKGRRGRESLKTAFFSYPKRQVLPHNQTHQKDVKTPNTPQEKKNRYQRVGGTPGQNQGPHRSGMDGGRLGYLL